LCVETLGAPAVCRREEVAGLGAAAQIAPQQSQVCGNAQFERSGLFALRDRQGLFKQFLRFDQHSGAFEDKLHARSAEC
jgi:hypothetical protein